MLVNVPRQTYWAQPVIGEENFKMSNHQSFRRPQLRPDSPVKPAELDYFMPATPPLAALAKIEFWLKIVRRRHHFRSLFVPLLGEEDLVLSDIGFNRTDIEWALELPLKVDALKALEACRKARTGRGSLERLELVKNE